MADIVLLTADKLGKGLTINPITKLLDLVISADDSNSLNYGSDNGLFVEELLTSGSYNDLTDQPTIPTNNTQLTNGAGYITSVPVNSVNGKVGNVVLTLDDIGLVEKSWTLTNATYAGGVFHYTGGSVGLNAGYEAYASAEQGNSISWILPEDLGAVASALVLSTEISSTIDDPNAQIIGWFPSLNQFVIVSSNGAIVNMDLLAGDSVETVLDLNSQEWLVVINRNSITVATYTISLAFPTNNLHFIAQTVVNGTPANSDVSLSMNASLAYGYVKSVNGKVGVVSLTASDVGAASSGDLVTAASTANNAMNLAQVNQLNIGNKADQVDLEAVIEDVAASVFALLNKASQVDLDALALVVDSKATPADVTAAIAAFVGAAPEALDTWAEIVSHLQGDASDISVLFTGLANRVRYDAAQSLTTPQQDQARANIVAEKVGVAAALVSAITPSSIGAATATQGTKADTALQSSDVAPVAISGNFNDLINKSSLFNLAYSAYVIGSNVALAASDTLGQMIGKLQGQISAIKSSLSTVATSGAYADLTGKPTIPAAQVNSDWNASSGVAQILNKPILLKGDKGDQGVQGGTGLTGAAGTNGTNGTNGNSLTRPSKSLASASGVLTINLALGFEIYSVTLFENITSIVIQNWPSTGFTAEISIEFTQAGSGSAWTVANPATAGGNIGGVWAMSTVLGVTDVIGLRLTSASKVKVFWAGVGS